MTPYHTPHTMQTPRYGQTPNNSNGTFAQPTNRPPQSSRQRTQQYNPTANHTNSSSSSKNQQWASRQHQSSQSQSQQHQRSSYRSSPHVPSPKNRYSQSSSSSSNRSSHHSSSYQSASQSSHGHHSKNASNTNDDDDDWEKGADSWEAAVQNRNRYKHCKIYNIIEFKLNIFDEISCSS